MGERSDLFLETKFFLLSDSFSVKKLAKRGGHRFGRSGRHTDHKSQGLNVSQLSILTFFQG